MKQDYTKFIEDYGITDPKPLILKLVRHNTKIEQDTKEILVKINKDRALRQIKEAAEKVLTKHKR